VKEDKPESTDIALIHGRTADGEGLRVLRRRDDRVELGDVRPLEQGKPIQGEVVTLKPRPEFPLLCDVKVELEAPQQRGDKRCQHAGPARVASDEYRRNWERIFRRDENPELAN
jgi:hypothetical protein